MPDSMPDLSTAERRRVVELLAALRAPIETFVSPSSPILTASFEEEFRSRLLSQHFFLGNPLCQDSFDRAFIASAEVAGFGVTEAPKGTRFWDVQLDGRKISLKSTRARDLRSDSLHISKLTEAAWIQDCRNAKLRHEKTLALFDAYCGEVDEIVQLRYFESRGLYELVGIPAGLLKAVLKLPISEFDSDGPSIKIPVGKIPPDFTLKLDRSDAKITLTKIVVQNCLVHARWQVGLVARRP